MSEWLPGYDAWKTTDPRDYEPEEPPIEEDPDRRSRSDDRGQTTPRGTRGDGR